MLHSTVSISGIDSQVLRLSLRMDSFVEITRTLNVYHLNLFLTQNKILVKLLSFYQFEVKHDAGLLG